MVGSWSWSWFAPVVFGFQIGSGDDFFLSAWVCVCLCLCLCLWFVVCARGLRSLRKKKTVGKPRKRNNKERRNNNILIKIEFFDVGRIVKWYSISNKVTF